LIAIITTVKNGSQHVDAYLEAIKIHLSLGDELVICDAYSEDGTFEKLLSFQSKRPNLTLIQEHGSIYDGLNACLKEIKSEYYLVLGIDDRLIEHTSALWHLLLDSPDLVLLPVIVAGNLQTPMMFNYKSQIMGWFKNVVSHSGGLIINKRLHKNYGLYKNDFDYMGDGDFINWCVKNRRFFNYKTSLLPACYFETSGISNSKKYMSHYLTYRILSGRSFSLLQYIILLLRQIKSYLRESKIF
jgi:glycosyltransferase involved in cell wall biosynthesis